MLPVQTSCDFGFMLTSTLSPRLEASVRVAEPTAAPAEFFNSTRRLAGESAAEAGATARVAIRAAKTYLIAASYRRFGGREGWPDAPRMLTTQDEFLSDSNGIPSP